MKRHLKWICALSLVVILGAFGFTFVVREGTCAIVSRFGKIREVRAEAGLRFRLPWPAENVVTLDTRSQYLDSGYTETLTHDRKNVILQTYMVWKIADPSLFYTSIGGMETARQYLSDLLANAKNGVMGGYGLSSLVSVKSEDIRLDEIERGIQAMVTSGALENYGIRVETVRIKRLALPNANVESVFEQMRTERQKYVTQLLSEGERDAAIIRSRADADAARIIADGQAQAAVIEAETEKRVAEIYAGAYEKNPELFTFLKRLTALEESVGGNTVLIMDSEESPFSVLTGKQKKSD
ncbi:MAG: protease modulator HflC [Synergistaceae bacterium]|jgi:membrane protease subunit HflC|nr:protease modulator HflC [Synergistaceae bacterium]